MPTNNNSRDELLLLFPDNIQNLIEAKDIRTFVNTIYDEAVIKGEDVVDNLITISSTLPLSAHQGYILNISKENTFGNPPQNEMALYSNMDGQRYWKVPISVLSQLEDVSNKLPNDGDHLTYDSTEKKWIPKSPLSISNIMERGGRQWQPKLTYKRGDIVSDKTLLYMAKLDNFGVTPGLYSGTWELIKDIESLTDLSDVEIEYGTVNEGHYLRANNEGIFSNHNFTLDVIDILYKKLKSGIGIDIEQENFNIKISLNAVINDLLNVSAYDARHEDILIFNAHTRNWENSNILNKVDRGGNEWVSNHTYIKGALVTRQGLTYTAIFSNINEDPLFSSNWKLTSLSNLPDVVPDATDLESNDLLTYDTFAHQWVKRSSTFTGGTEEYKYKIPILNSQGKLDPSMIEVTMFHRIDSWDPSWGDEYPDITGHTPGAFWDIIFYDPQIHEYTFSTGDLVGQTVKAGDFIIWGLGGWTIMPAVMNPIDYYRRDGTLPITANFDAGNFRLTKVAQGSAINDAVNVEQLQTKENTLGNPDISGKVLSSTADGIRSWIEMTSGISEINWGDITGDIDNQTDLIQKFDQKADIINIFDKTEYLEQSTGIAGLPIITTTNGKIDSSFIDIQGLTFVSNFTPVLGNECPTDTPNINEFWVINNLVVPFNFSCPDLSELTAVNGDWMLYGNNGWSLVNNSMDPDIYYLIDGSRDITGPFAGGNQQIKNIAQGTDDTDAITLFQHNQHKNDLQNPHQITKTQIGLDQVENISPQDLPISDDVQNALDGKEDWLQNPIVDGMVLSSQIDGTREWIDLDTQVDWGDIQGDIINQTDLNNELENRVKRSGDTMPGQLTVNNTIKAEEFYVNSLNGISKYTFDNTAIGVNTALLWNSSISEFQFRLNDDIQYTILHEGNINPEDYLRKDGGRMTGDLYLDRAEPTTAMMAATKFYVDTQINQLPSPNDIMLKSIYDTDNTNIVDDSERLGGKLPSYYASINELGNYVQKSGDIMTGPLTVNNIFTTNSIFTNNIKIKNNAQTNESKIEFTDTNFPNEKFPAIKWNDLSKNFRILQTNNTEYVIWHSGNFDKADFIQKSGDIMTGPLTLDKDPEEDLHAATKSYVDDAVSQIPDNVMTTDVYDTNTSGIVDDSERLGGENPDYYATKSELDTKLDKTGGDISGDLHILGNFFALNDSNFDHLLANYIKVQQQNGISKIEFTDQNIPGANPGILWDSISRNMKIEEENGTRYTIYHSGNLPDGGTDTEIVRRTFIGDGSTKTFQIDHIFTPGNANVYYNGVRIFEPDDVDINFNNKIVFTTAPEVGDRIDFEGFTAALV